MNKNYKNWYRCSQWVFIHLWWNKPSTYCLNIRNKKKYFVEKKQRQSQQNVLTIVFQNSKVVRRVLASCALKKNPRGHRNICTGLKLTMVHPHWYKQSTVLFTIHVILKRSWGYEPIKYVQNFKVHGYLMNL